MRVGVLGTGEVGRRLGDRLLADGHEVTLGSRDPDSPVAADWAAERPGAGHGTFAEAAEGAALLVNATPGRVSSQVLAGLPQRCLDGVVVLDVANPLDFDGGFPPTLAVCNTDSLGERLQRAHPTAKVVKALNTLHNEVMVDPARVPGEHHVFVCGDDADAKGLVIGLLVAWGWPPTSLIDLGDITNARATEMLLPLWVRLYAHLGTADFNLGVVR